MAAPNAFYTMRPVIPQTRSDTSSRVTIKNIPLGVTEAQLKANLSKHGDIRVHMFVPATEYGLGWAWVTCEKHEDVEKMLAYAAEKREKEAAALRESAQESVQAKKDNDGASDAAEAADAAAETSADDAKSSECSEEVLAAAEVH
ncbi:hypothetical protein, conserved [Eimeria acervulina]|uniref:RRM domain-containing protein n=1 Tax=Eimeria acervulina TaxID=5801 RepID=U6GJU1_EIMAC|nr:hypothetical protein, conserved [Eimeria acervulina]CDI80440.1 hypothetical protein, conserved [Eimeria acervulina]